MSEKNTFPDDTRTGSALIIAVLGLFITAALVCFLVWYGWKPSETATIVGPFTTIIGTLVGAFLGVQVGSTGRQKAENLANSALGALPPDKAKEILQSS